MYLKPLNISDIGMLLGINVVVQWLDGYSYSSDFLRIVKEQKHISK